MGRDEEVAARPGDGGEGGSAIGESAKVHFYAPSQHGSWSLKAVLPAACPDLSYEALDGVADGNMAVEAYQEAPCSTSRERRYP